MLSIFGGHASSKPQLRLSQRLAGFTGLPFLIMEELSILLENSRWSPAMNNQRLPRLYVKTCFQKTSCAAWLIMTQIAQRQESPPPMRYKATGAACNVCLSLSSSTQTIRAPGDSDSLWRLRCSAGPQRNGLGECHRQASQELASLHMFKTLSFRAVMRTVARFAHGALTLTGASWMENQKNSACGLQSLDPGHGDAAMPVSSPKMDAFRRRPPRAIRKKFGHNQKLSERLEAAPSG